MVQEVITRSWGGRLLAAFCGGFMGLALIAGSFFLVFWNEGHGLHTAESLRQTQQALISVPNQPLDPRNNLRPVYFSGLATTNEVLQDSLLGVAQQAIMLIRTVEMYQWEEHTDTQTQEEVGGSEREVKNYSYSPVWSGRLIASSQFKDRQNHQNPARMLIEARTLQAKNVKIGDFYLPAHLVTQMRGASILDLSHLDLRPLQAKIDKPLQHADYSIYVGKDPQNPAIGDLRVTVSQILPQTVSVIAQQKGKTVQAYPAPAGETVELLAMGHQSPERMISQAETENKVLTWILRFISFWMMFFGLFLLFRPVVVLADFLPLVESLVAVGAGLLAFTGALLLWSLAMAIAWFVVRPLWSLGLMVFVVLLSYIIFAYHEKRSN